MQDLRFRKRMRWYRTFMKQRMEYITALLLCSIIVGCCCVLIWTNTNSSSHQALPVVDTLYCDTKHAPYTKEVHIADNIDSIVNVSVRHVSRFYNAQRATKSPFNTFEGRKSCKQMVRYPLHHARIMRRASLPQNPWEKGHRGVDLYAEKGDYILSPMDAVISFVGQVAHKRVVSIQSGNTIVAFEPAVTHLKVGEAIAQGEQFARVAIGSDHCDDQCLHWSMRIDGKYVDPEFYAGRWHTVLKPLARVVL